MTIESTTPLTEIISLIIVAIIGAIAGYIQNKSKNRGKEIVDLAKESQLQQEAIIDLATFGFKAYQANADGKVTQEEYNIIAAEGKQLAVKYADKFGVRAEVEAILSAFEPAKPE